MEMECGDLFHLGAEYIVTNLLLYSSSPHARRLAEQLLTSDPFNIDIKLDENSKSRNVEILNAYLKTMGLRLVFEKHPKKRIKPLVFQPINKVYTSNRVVNPIIKIGDHKDLTKEDLAHMIKERGVGVTKPIHVKPIKERRTRK